jgi:5-dehydro-2-deoxygluconokinase
MELEMALSERPLELIAMGRAAVDLYGEQIGGRLEDMSSFAKYLGGCPANIATGASRLGLKVAMLTRVGDEHMGRFVREQLAAEGVDVSHVETDPARLTGLVILGIRDRETFPLIFYRENCADMAIAPEDFDEPFIASSKALLVTGTHFSTASTDKACRIAISYAKKNGTKVVFDIDYRPVLWGLTGRGLGEQRFIASDTVSKHLQSILPYCDLIVGTEEEVHIAGGSTDTTAALRKIRSLTRAAIVLKRGAQGCSIFPDAIPAHADDGITHRGFVTEVFNVLGAGDGFLAGFLRGWLRGESWEKSAAYANGCGALVVSRHACAPAMPSMIELDALLRKETGFRLVHADTEFDHLHRNTTGKTPPSPVLALAFDHRKQFAELAEKFGAGKTQIEQFKSLLARALEEMPPELSGAIIDDTYGEEPLTRLTGTGRWLARPVEVPGSLPLAFEAGDRLTEKMRSWPAEHVAKCLAAHDPNHPVELCRAQEASLIALQNAANATGRRWLLEIIPPEFANKPSLVAQAVEALYRAKLFPTWWKLPALGSLEQWNEIAQIVRKHDAYCAGVIVLGLDQPLAELTPKLKLAKDSGIGVGFAIGRSIWRQPAEKWFAKALDDRAAVETIKREFAAVVAVWR